LNAVLEEAFAKAENLTGAFPQVSGLQVRVDVTRPHEQRVVSVSVDNKPLDVNSTYTLATNDFLANGGDGYQVLQSVKRVVGETDAKLLADVIMTYLAEKLDVAPKVEQRVIVARGKEPQ
jgi:2',3'-cyclic-nucleotide 2'-phosphodiesterase (5'-nucleotidase family)